MRTSRMCHRSAIGSARSRSVASLVVLALVFQAASIGPFARFAMAAGSSSAMHGDITGDGVADGRDALKVMRVVEGFEQPTPEEVSSGDVYPLAGTGDRLMGDGALTEEDAAKILRGAVGLLSSGEVTGDFTGSPPIIYDFEPSNGPSGTSVTITGQNFLAGNPAENLVRFGDTQATVTSVTGTQIIASVPQGAKTGLIRAVTPGGVADSPGEFCVTEMTPGVLALGTGVNPQDFTVVSKHGETTSDSGGGFDLALPPDSMTLVGAVPKGEGKNTFLSLVMPPAVYVEGQGSGGPGAQGGAGTQGGGEPALRIDAASTAKALVFLHPFFATGNQETARLLLDLMDGLPELAALATAIGQRYPAGAPGLDDPVVRAAWGQAVIALMNALPASIVRSLDENEGVAGQMSPSGLGAMSSGEEKKVAVYGLDKDFLYPEQVKGKPEISVTPINGYTPVDWLVMLYKLDPAAFPRGLNQSFLELREQVFTRLPYEQAILVPATLWTQRIDIVYAAADWLVNEVFDAIMTSNNSLPISISEDAVYIMRAFSGVVSDPQGFDFKVIDAMPSGKYAHGYALAVNLSLAAIDFWDLITPEAKRAQRAAIVKGVQNAVRKISQISTDWGALDTDEKAGALLSLIGEILKAMASTLPQAGATTAQEKMADTGIAVVKNANAILGLLDKISSVGRIGERLLGLLAMMANPLALEISPGPTPLESAFVVVGDPFGPKITSFQPLEGGSGTEVTITGRGLSPEPGENEVAFALPAAEAGDGSNGKSGDPAQAEVISATQTELVVRVPYGVSGPCTILVETPSGGPVAAQGTFNVFRTPRIAGITPGYGFPAAPGYEPGSALNPGTRFYVECEYFEYTDYLEVSGGAGEPSDCGNDPENLRIVLPADVVGEPYEDPAGWTGAAWSVRAVAGDTGVKSEPVPVHLVGVPTIEYAAPETVLGLGAMTIFGKNYSLDPNLIKVRLEYGGNVVWRITDNSWSMIRTTMPPEVPEGTEVQVAVETPAGRSNAVTVTRGTGVVQGGTVPVHTADMTVAADGIITLPEAVQMVTGEIDPFAPPWDDVDETYTTHYYEEKYNAGTEQDPSWAYRWVEGETVVEKDERGHPGNESAEYLRVEHHHVDRGGGVSNPTWVRSVSLDTAPGRTEEGDFVTGQVGALSGDTISISGVGALQIALSSPLILDTGYDKITIPADIEIRGEIILASNGNQLTGGWVANPDGSGITIRGNDNVVKTNVKDCAVRGVLIDGGCRNQVGDGITRIEHNDGIGIEVTGGAKSNVIWSSWVRYNGTGLWIHGTGTDGNRFIGIIKNSGDGLTSGDLGDGVVISDGARENKINDGSSSIWSIRDNRLDGVLILGEGTDGNIVGGCFDSNKKNGVHIAGGASGNTVKDAKINSDWESGVLIEGGSDNNALEYVTVKLCKEAGVKVLGDTDPPGGTTMYAVNVSDSPIGIQIGGINVWAPGPDGSLMRPAEITGAYTNRCATGILLSAGTQDVFITDAEPGDCAEGIVITGADTQRNKITGGEPYLDQAGTVVRITGGAHHNTVDGMNIEFEPGDTTAESFGIVIDGGAEHNLVRNVVIGPDSEGPDGDRAAGTGVVIDGANFSEAQGVAVHHLLGNGVVVTNGAESTDIWDLTSCYNLGSGIVVSGEGVTDTSLAQLDLSGNDEAGLLIEGAVNTQIGDLGGEAAPSFLASNAVAGIWVTAGATNTYIYDCDIVGNPAGPGLNNNGILVDGGALHVRIGKSGPEGRNVIGLNGRNGIVIKGGEAASGPRAGKRVTDVIIQNTFIGITPDGEKVGNDGNGVVVEGGPDWVWVGAPWAGTGNVISGNAGAGVLIDGTDRPATDVVISGNIIGMDPERECGVPNGTGVHLASGTSSVGVTGNKIEENTADGVLIDGGSANNLVDGNLVTGNGRDGVRVSGTGSVRNDLRRNIIADNWGKGIALLTGGNNGIASPVIDGLVPSQGLIIGRVPSGVPQGSTVDVFLDFEDEGMSYVGSSAVIRNRFSVQGWLREGVNLHAVVTDPEGNTSEFGPSEVAAPGTGARRTYTYTSTRDGSPAIYLRQARSDTDIRLTPDEAVAASQAETGPALSPDLTRILFASERSGAGYKDIWVMNVDGSGATPVTNEAAHDAQPSWSPDSTKAVFVSNRDGDEEIYVADEVPPGPSGEIYYDDGTAEGNTGLNAGGCSAVRFSTSAGTLAGFRVFVRLNPCELGWKVHKWNAGTLGDVVAEGTATATTTGWLEVDVGAVQVPREYAIAIYYATPYMPSIGVDQNGPSAARSYSKHDSTFTATTRNYMIRAVVAARQPARLTQSAGADRDPAWSPDGTKIAFASARAGNMDVWVMGADGSDPVRLTDNPSADYKPAWSPDSSKIAFVSERDGNPELYVMDASGETGAGSAVRLTSSAGVDTDPTYTRDGKILFASDRGAGLEIHSTDPDGSGLAKLTYSLGQNAEPDAGQHVAQIGGLGATGTGGGAMGALGALAAMGVGGAGDTPGLVLAVESKKALPGTQVTVAVDLAGAEYLGNLAFDLLYDKYKMDLVSVTAGPLWSSGLCAVNPENLPSDSGRVRFNWVKAAGYTGDCRVMTLTFAVAGDVAGEDLRLTLAGVSACDAALGDLPVDQLSGVLSVPLVGDVDRDGAVTLFDLVIVSRSIGAGAPVRLAADVNLDGRVDEQDLTDVLANLGRRSSQRQAPP